ncbi:MULTISPECIES: zinc-dependent alcohol dehydrogenase family protein [Nannocystis]|uniref:alcohol dehydrogenase n=1 Tax=Nannocystis radixulma TaxID=2995305 RepID=A0ABT5B7W6_9BACT|nr:MULTISPECIES: zinc-dependent alcohol dehydrogenase family protein [Nannocystis]MCY1057261.1 zinc-dependent alcohol dehydrogenase family protein [Nannocystis sp. SCPEA4]MDC0670197.1 zinc-dependent alcohol dehydrogenase family protein [Nannocystis radixulma]
MRAMVLERVGEPLQLVDRPAPEPGPHQVVIQVAACGVCRTDLHVVDGDLPDPKLPLICGHEIVGRIVARGARAGEFPPGTRVGVPWLGGACGHCNACLRGQENLCPNARFTGYTLDGGYSELALADARFCFEVPARYQDVEAAPLLCAGLIGYRSYRLAGNPGALGLYGFGAAAHILCQLAAHERRRVYAFTRPGDTEAQEFARSLGAVWAGGSDEVPPEPLDAAILFAPVGALVPAALRVVRPGGVVVCGGIHMSDIPGFPYELLWGERVLRSVANLTRADGHAFFAAAARTPLRLATHTYPLTEANQALADLRTGAFTGAAVLVP